ncbi:S8 family serine peptidase [Geodermatophilus tzadiensis]|uniref:S8 family serine peptidase n=1 Tax=Geodermatophilus tzadiensis TaxID=1137988 RepID=UPI001B808C24|nr:S8 family serine peptidase [Geodermatophilus tzadiensis]
MSRGWGRRGIAALAATTATLGGVVMTAGPAAAAPLGYDVNAKGSLFHIAQAVGAHDSYRAGFTGRGVGVALIDTGVTEVPGLDTGNVVDGPDLSFDSQDPELAHRDAYGHGTHLASIIAGRDVAGTPASYTDPSRFSGIAPDATLLDVKVGASDGAVDVTQVIAAIDWVVEHRNDNGMNIRVINLSYGTDSTQDTRVDPLSYAVEQAWKAGIVVVVAGGNDGSTNLNLANPAQDPYVLAVGAADTQGTLNAVDDTVPSWGTRGTNQRHVDVVAPGVSVTGLRVPSGYADERNPGARRGDRFAVASGTSQAAAVVSGEVALLLQEEPRLTPDQVKRQIMSTSTAFSSTTNQYRGNGLTNVRQAQVKSNNTSTQSAQFWSTGTGSVEAARGSSHVERDGVPLQGEVDVFGNAWDGRAWATASGRQTAWEGGRWRGVLFSGDGWDGSTWRTAEWTAVAWDGRQWRDADWSGRQWRDGSWTGISWNGRQWRDANWSGRQWRTADLAGAAWS